MLKAVIIMICFKEIYGIGVAILREFLDSILNVISLESTNLAEALLNNIQRRNLYSSCLFSIADLLACTNMSIYYERYRAISNEDRNSICINRIIKFR